MKKARFKDWWIEMVTSHHRAVLVASAIITALALVSALRLGLETDLRTLMPQGHPVVTRLRALEHGFGALGSVDLVVKGGDREARRAFAEAVGDELAGHPEIRDVEWSPEIDFFIEHSLYYLTDDEIEELDERIMAVEHYNLCTSAPDLCIEAPDPQASQNLRNFVEDKRARAHEYLGFDRYYEREGIDALVVFIYPVSPSDDLAFCRRITDELRSRIGSIRASEGPWTETNLEFNLVGPYVSKGEEQRHVPRDMLRSGLVGLLGIMLVLLALFRSLKALVTLLLPLLAGVVWSMALTQLLLAHLNTMTSLIGSVILGIGIDTGIHLLTRVRAEVQEHAEFEAIRRGFRALMGPLLIASITTIGAFVAMMTSDFPAFREFGIIGGIGVATCLLAMLTVFPALLCSLGVPRQRRRGTTRPDPGSGAHRAIQWMLQHPRVGLACVVLVTTLAAPGVRSLYMDGFERDGRRLKSDHVRDLIDADGELVMQIFGKNSHPSILLVEDYETLQRVFPRARELHEARLAAGDSSIVSLFSVVQLMPNPNIDLTERRSRIDQITENFSETTWTKLDPPLDEPSSQGDEPALTPTEARQLRRMLEAQPFTVEDLPPDLLARMRTRDGQWAIFAYPNFYGDIISGVDLIEESKLYSETGAPYVGEETVFAAMYELMRHEWPWVSGIAAVVVFVTLFVQTRTVLRTMLIVLPLVVGIWWMLGAMGTLGVQFTLLNVTIFPTIIGLGADHGAYLVSAIDEASSAWDTLAAQLTDTARAIAAASVTTGIGFASLMVADSGGVRSIGAVAVLGVTISAIAALAVLPTVAGLVGNRFFIRGGSRVDP